MMTDEYILNSIEEMTMNAKQLQLETLCTILQRNRGVNHLHPYLAGGDDDDSITDANFRRLVPLSTYDDYIVSISKLAAGELADHDLPLLSFDPLLFFFYSSGSSSMKPKLIPYFNSIPGRSVSSLAHRASAATLRRLFPPRPTANKILWFIYGGNVTKTKGGYKTMGATSYGLQTDTKSSSIFFSTIISPKEVVLNNNIHQQMYCHLLCGLKNFDSIDAIRAPYASALITAFDLLKSKWEHLCNDLENGFPYSEITDLSMRESVTKIIDGPRPDISLRIRSICQEKQWEGVLSKLWPNTRYIKTVSSGSMKQYFSKLKYYAGKIPILGGDYFASECSIALNLDISQPPELTRYVMLPKAAYFEFIQFDSDKSCVSTEQTVDISEVEIGKMYEIVVTTYRGLYRYRLGDIIKVVGFHNSSPEIEFIMRAPKSSQDIITEKNLLSAFESCEISKDNNIEFASFFDAKTEPKQLKVFVEIKEGYELLEGSIERYCCVIEQGLGGVYEAMKGRGEVKPLLLFILRFGSFDRLFQETLEKGSPAAQYKPPKIIRSLLVAELLESCAILIVKAA